jgi:hypothetical protein
MFHVYTPENMPTSLKQQKDNDNWYLFSLCTTYNTSLLGCIYPEGENLVVSLVKNDEKRLVAVHIDNCINDSFKKWIKRNGNAKYDSDKTEGITYTMFFTVPEENYEKFDNAWKLLYEPDTENNSNCYCLLL